MRVAVALVVLGVTLVAAIPLSGGPSVTCIFDIDHTLTRAKSVSASYCNVSSLEPAVGTAHPGVYARQAIAQCLQKGYHVAVATAEPKWWVEKNMDFLHWVGNGTFNATFFDSPAFQHGNLVPVFNKTLELDNVLNYYKTSPECTIFYDDSAKNGAVATTMKVNWQEASESCGGDQICEKACGISQSEFEQGQATLQKICPSALA